LKDSNPPDYSKRIKAARQCLGLTQKQLADLVGVSFTSINRWENEKARPTPLAWKRILEAEALGQQATSGAIHQKGGTGRAIHEAAATYSVSPNEAQPLDFSTPAQVVSAVLQGYRLAYGHQFNPAFATETALIDPLPHQRLAVYEHMLPQPRLRFLLADDAGAGKTIMAGLYIREMLARRLIRRVLIVPPAGLVSNWERELRTLFSLHFQIVSGADVRRENPFAGPEGDCVIISVDTLAGDKAFARLAEEQVAPYDLVIFDEAHKLSADREPDFRVRKTERYTLAEALAGANVGASSGITGGAAGEKNARRLPWAATHLILLTATPHMGKDYPYYCLWRLLEPEVLPTIDAFNAYPPDARARRFIRRTKEEMVRFDGTPIYPTRISDTLSYNLTQGAVSEQALYDEATAYIDYYYNRARILNRSAARLAMSIFQRRLASSTWAMICSLKRRLERLNGLIADIRSGKITTEQLLARQRALDDQARDMLDETTADEEGTAVDETGEVVEAHEINEAQALGGVVATTLDELEAECLKVQDLLKLATDVYNLGHESKFDRLMEVLDQPQYQNEKMIIFTEHRDTLNFLVRRLEGMGYTGKIVQIHGQMDRFERDAAVETFRKPLAQGGAQFLIATDAAGEGINLQVCWLMVNYDIPWNPARLEQRMGRIHRYGQQHDPVIILNMAAGKTREGRVILTLLTKLEAIRKELHSDKVFDVIGRMFDGVSLQKYLEKALTESGADQAIDELNGKLTPEQVRAIQERDRRLFGDGGDVKRELPRLNTELEREAYRRLLPGYVRSFVEMAAPLLGLAFEGDLDRVFSLKSAEPGALDAVSAALGSTLESYPPEIHNRFCFTRQDGARQDGHRHDADHPAIYLHPGEPFFDRFLTYVLARFARGSAGGAVFVDPTITAPYQFHLAEGSVLRQADPQNPALAQEDAIEHRLIAVREEVDGSVTPVPVETLLLLRGGGSIPPAAISLAARAEERLAATKTAIHEAVLAPLAAAHRAALTGALPEREQFLRVGYGYQEAELAAARARFQDKVSDGDTHAQVELARIKERQRNLAALKAAALQALHREPELICPGDLVFLTHALVVPSSDPEDVRHRDAMIEKIAMQTAIAHEQAAHALVHDVHTPEQSRPLGLGDYPGFDLFSRRPDGSERAIEVKGRAQRGDIDISENEWGAACNHRSKYWLYVVYDCAGDHPRLFRIQDPFGKLIAKAQAFRLSKEDIYSHAQEETTEG